MQSFAGSLASIAGRKVTGNGKDGDSGKKGKMLGKVLRTVDRRDAKRRNKYFYFYIPAVGQNAKFKDQTQGRYKTPAIERLYTDFQWSNE